MNLVERARDLRPLLLGQQAETERRTHYSDETHRLFEEAGLYRMLVPKRYGGLEVDVPTYLRVVIELARGCPASAWCLAHAAGPALQVASLFEEDAQEEIFGSGDVRWVAAAESGVARRRDGGWHLSGTFAGCPGARYATHLLGRALACEQGADGPATPLLVVASREQWEVLDDDGDPLGLRGSGRQSLRFDGALIPDRLVLADTLLEIDGSEGTPGYRLHGNPLYAGRALGFFQAELSAVLIGAAATAVDEYERLVREEQTPSPPIGPRRLDPDYQRWLGAAIGRVTAAELLLAETAEQFMDACAGIESGQPFSREADMRLTAMGREAMKLAWSAVHDIVIRTAGSAAMQHGERIERIARDMLTGFSEAVTEEAVARELARERLGLPVAS